jgi:hypothetical protein
MHRFAVQSLLLHANIRLILRCSFMCVGQDCIKIHSIRRMVCERTEQGKVRTERADAY